MALYVSSSLVLRPLPVAYNIEKKNWEWPGKDAMYQLF